MLNGGGDSVLKGFPWSSYTGLVFGKWRGATGEFLRFHVRTSQLQLQLQFELHS